MAEQGSQPVRGPRFRVGDEVRTVGPTVRPRKTNYGTVSEIVGSPTDAIYRYRVAFADGAADTFFGFELELIEF